jgi:hypothetical protein
MSVNAKDPDINFMLNGVNVHFYKEAEDKTNLEIIHNNGGSWVYIKDSTNQYYTIKEDATFASTIYVSMSAASYIDMFPSFTFQNGSGFKLLW